MKGVKGRWLVGRFAHWQSCTLSRRRRPFSLLYAAKRLLGVYCEALVWTGLAWGRGRVRAPFAGEVSTLRLGDMLAGSEQSIK